jgi:hypothetical protein
MLILFRLRLRGRQLGVGETHVEPRLPVHVFSSAAIASAIQRCDDLAVASDQSTLTHVDCRAQRHDRRCGPDEHDEQRVGVQVLEVEHTKTLPQEDSAARSLCSSFFGV